MNADNIARRHIDYRPGLPEALRAEAAELYDQAFGFKFASAIADARSRRRLFAECFLCEYALAALAPDGRLLGLAGFHSRAGALTGGITFARLCAHLGTVRGMWAALLLSLYEREPAPRELVMDGIAVRADARGRGIGGRLLDEIAAYARAHGYERVRLDVIDINPRAKKLYERKGFSAVSVERFEWLRWLLKFGGATRMELRIGE
ncbi:MAG: GNAT family N-acetyltransferase [Gammaproteobacteria bacterium]